MPDSRLDAVRHDALWFEPTAGGMQPLVDAVGDARLVLIGEASHGTHEFYRTRAELTKVLIEEHGFNLVAVEADWPDAYRVNRWVRGPLKNRGRKRRFRSSRGSRAGCGGTSMSWRSSAGCTSTIHSARRNRAPDSTDWISTACIGRSKPSSAI